MNEYYTITNPHFEKDTMVITINGEEKHFLLLDISPSLLNATEEERNHFEISPSGYGIHWPLIDEDLSIDGLLGIVHKPEWKRKTA